MSSEPERPSGPDPYGSVTTCVYDAAGRLSRVEDGWGRTYRYDQDGRCLGSDAGAGQDRPRPTAAPTPRLARTFAFRLCGAETQEQTLALEGLGAAAAVVAIQRVQASVSGAGQAGAAMPISGIEVHADLRDGRVVCTAQVSDFAAGDLVVVQVEIAVYALPA